MKLWTRDEYLALRERSPNLRACLRVIREGESYQDDRGYFVRYGGHKQAPKFFDDLSKHPRIFELTKDGRKSSAAGAYQITATTYDDFAPRIGVTAFERDDQDALAIAIMHEENALDDALQGRLGAWVAKLGGRWSSLPSNTDGQPTIAMAEAAAVFAKYGGALLGTTEQPAVPITEIDLSAVPPREEPMEQPTSSITWGDVAKVGGTIASFFNPFVGAVITSLSPLLQEKIAKEVGRHTDPGTAKAVAANLSDVITKTVSRETQSADQFEAVAALRKDPVLAAKVEQAVAQRLEELAPFIEALHKIEREQAAMSEQSMQAAFDRERSVAPEQSVQRPVLSFTQWALGISTAFIGALLGLQIYMKNGEEPSGQLIILFVMLVTTFANTFRTQNDYAFGSSRGSSAKDALNTALAAEITRRK